LRNRSDRLNNHRKSLPRLMSLQDIVILIPSHSLEDFPTEQTDLPAASLMNAFSVAWHPSLLAWAESLPRWRRADEPTAVNSNQLIFVPTVCDDWLPHGWVEEARAAGATVISGMHDRPDMEAAALAAVPEPVAVSADLVADFYSLGFCWLEVELLSRHMRNFSNVDEGRTNQRAIAAAKAAIADDRETAEAHLRGCFELLLEARERFYPVECYLLDLCLTFHDMTGDKLLEQIQRDVPFSLLASAVDLAAICEKSPGLREPLSAATTAGRIDIVGGEDRETPLPLLPLESALFQFARGREHLQALTGCAPAVWGRRKYGLSTSLPQILSKLGFKAAMHVVLDDGIYPDHEYTKLRWRGCDESIIDAFSRIPLATDSASSYLRFPVRMAESMDHDQVAGLIFARWPDVSAPWFEDLRRSQKYAPVLGRFVTLQHFFENTELPGQLSTYQAHEYFPPYLIQSIARREVDAISRYAAHTLRRRRFDVALWCRNVSRALMSRPVESPDVAGMERDIEAAAPDSDADAIAKADQTLAAAEADWPRDLAKLVMHSADNRRGFLLVNALSGTRRACVSLPGLKSAPAVSGPIKAAHVDPAKPEKSVVVVELPGAGYVWIPEDERGAPAPPLKQPLVEAGLLRNEWFEVAINEQTGGIGHIRFHDQRAKRLSQQLSFRFPRERTIGTGDEAIRTQYAEMRCLRREISARGQVRGELTTSGEIIDQTNGERLASFRQSIRVWRARPIVEIDIELGDVKTIDGDPWNNYFASRFAWSDITSAVTRSVFHTAQGFGGERFETSDYIEAASEAERLTIIPHGLPFHRKTGPRMVDSLLIVAGETRRRFQFTIAVDAAFPLEAAWNATTPVAVIPTETGPPRAGASGWFFHLDSRNVQLTRILDLANPPQESLATGDGDTLTLPAGPGFAVRLLETEGHAKRIRLRTYRPPIYARKRNFLGQTQCELTLEQDTILIDMGAFEIADVELRFGQS
jgi:alpha-mannosidase